MANYPSLALKPERSKNVIAGHPWIFSGALSQKPNIDDGSLVKIIDGKNFLGIGYYNSNTDIAVRMLTRKDEEIDVQFFIERITQIKIQKEIWLPTNTNAYRVIFGEADGLPGLVVDKYANVLVVQLHTLGMNVLKTQIVEALIEVYKPLSIVERSDIAVRKYEGLTDQPIGNLYGTETPEVEILENGFKFIVPVLTGQKTGFFLDQRENRAALQKYIAGRSLLNAFSYSGGFSVYAAKLAKEVVSVDVSAPAMEYARKNFALNHIPLDPHGFVLEDVFDHLKNLPVGKHDAILLDPPSFAKSKHQVPGAIKAYITLNSQALMKLPDYGLLISSSCTTHVDPYTFIKILHQSAAEARCTIKLLEAREQPFDHPYNLAFPEGRYLKFYILQKWPL